MQRPNIISETTHQDITLRYHADYLTLGVAANGRVLSEAGNWIGTNNGREKYLIASYVRDGRRLFVHIHRLVALCYVPNPDPARLDCVDHIDNDPGNNQVTNLRWVTKRENCQNLAKNKTGQSTSKYMGVGWRKREQRWAAQIRLDGKNKGLGQFKDEETAARAYDQALINAGLQPVNFPTSNDDKAS